MTSAELDLEAFRVRCAELVRDGNKLGVDPVVLMFHDDTGRKFSAICSQGRTELMACKIRRASDGIFDGLGVTTRQLLDGAG